jgi:hypothetical protein
MPPKFQQLHVKYQQQRQFGGGAGLFFKLEEELRDRPKKEGRKLWGEGCVSCSNDDNDRGRSVVRRNRVGFQRGPHHLIVGPGESYVRNGTGPAVHGHRNGCTAQTENTRTEPSKNLALPGRGMIGIREGAGGLGGWEMP